MAVVDHTGPSIVFILLLLTVAYIECYSGGAPKWVCDSMVPSHGGPRPQTTPSPFGILLNTTQVIPGGVIEVQLIPQATSNPFKGFMVTARKISESNNEVKAQGRFTIPPKLRQAIYPVDCDGVAGSGITHRDNSLKNRTLFNWVSPTEPGEYILYATFVESKNKFWVKVPSDEIKVREKRNTATPPSIREGGAGPPSSSNIYSGCGHNEINGKGCFGVPKNCVAKENCTMLATFKKDFVSNSFRIQLLGLLPDDPGTSGYVALGFSKDDQMGNDAVMACYSSPGSAPVHIHEYYNYDDNGSRKNKEVDRGTIQRKGRSGSIIDGKILCEFTIADVIDFSRSEAGGPRFELSQELLQLLLARGIAETSTLTYHGNTEADRGVSVTKAQLINYRAWDTNDHQGVKDNVANVEEQSEEIQVYEGCNENNCFGIPVNCIESKNCEVISKFEPVNSDLVGPVKGIDIVLSGTVSEDGAEGSYIAIGISDNMQMGSDSVFGCYVNNSEAKVGEFFNIPRSDGTKSWAVGRNTDEEKSFKTVYSKLENGRISCNFIIEPTISLEAQIKRTYNLNEENVFLLLAKGSSANDGKLGYHSIKAPSPEPFRLSAGELRPRESCLGYPPGCCQTQNCYAMVNFEAKKEGGEIIYEFLLDAKINGSQTKYLAVGISDDKKMDSDSVFACYDNGKVVKLGEYVNLPLAKANSPVIRNPLDKTLQYASGSMNGTHLSCKFLVEPKIDVRNQINKTFDLSENPYYIFIAQGSMKDLVAGKLGYHGSEKVISVDKILIPQKIHTSIAKAPTSSNPPEISASCAGTPPGCCSTGGCQIKTQFAPKKIGGSIIGYDIELEGNLKPEQKYIAFGLSKDENMGSDSVFGCYLDGVTAKVGEFYNIPKGSGLTNKPLKREGGLQIIMNSTAVVKDGRMTCSFLIKPKFDLTPEINEKFDLSEATYILLAGGPMQSPESGLGYHGSLKFVTGEKMIMAEKKDSNSGKATIRIELHGALMVIAWVLLASFGKFTARYYKKEFTGKQVCDKALWFVIHQFCMLTAVALTTIAIIIIFLEVGQYTVGIGTAEVYHPILGLVVFILAILQVFIALFRCDPSSEYRIIFNWIHWTVGTFCHWIGITCIFFSATLQKANLHSMGAYWSTIVVFVIFHLILHVVMSFHTFFMDNKHLITRALAPGPMKSNVEEKEICPADGSRYSEMILLIELFGATVCTAVLIYCICESV